MDGQLSLSIVEILVLMLGAITLGITIHFFIVSRRSINASSPTTQQKTLKALEEWKLRYLNDTELKDKELSALKQQLADLEENSQINAIEAEETRHRNKKLLAEIETLRQTATAPAPQTGFMEQLRQAQANLLGYNEKINQLIEQIDLVKEAEEKQQEMLRSHEELSGRVETLQAELSQKEKELQNARQKQELTREMSSMIDSTYNEFNVLQDKIQKLEGQVNASRKISLEYEDLREEHYKTSRELEESKQKYQAAVHDSHELRASLEETEDKLREANFQRQQLQKKVALLEELNNDLQAIADANKKLESQIKRMGELESLLHMVEEERDELARRQMKTP